MGHEDTLLLLLTDTQSLLEVHKEIRARPMDPSIFLKRGSRAMRVQSTFPNEPG